MKLSTRYKIARHKRNCPYIFRLETKMYPVTVQYRCAFEKKIICTEPQTNPRWIAMQIGRKV